MTIYLVFEGGGSDEQLFGVFSTRELAQAYIDRVGHKRLFIHEATLDQPLN